MSRIQKALNDLAEGNHALFETPMTGATVAIHDDQSASAPIKLTINGYWFEARDLRKTAKLFNKLAAMLEEQGRDPR